MTDAKLFQHDAVEKAKLANFFDQMDMGSS